MVLGEEYSSLSYIAELLGGPALSLLYLTGLKGGVRTGRGMVIYKECKYLTIYILPMKAFLRILAPPPKPQRLLLT